eukprot:10359602-Prorocentrum_lima.AAC.1
MLQERRLSPGGPAQKALAPAQVALDPCTMLAEALVLAVTLVAAVGLWRALSSRALGGKFRMVPGRRWLLGHTEIIHRLKEVHKVAA